MSQIPTLTDSDVEDDDDDEVTATATSTSVSVTCVREPEPGPGEREASPEPEQANSSQRVSKGMPRLRKAIKGVVGGAASHQLPVTSLAINYNIVAPGDKSNNNTHKDPGSAPHTELGSDQRQPDNG